MRPAPIPAEDVWDGAQRVVIGPPGGDLTDPDIASVEVLRDMSDIGPRMSARCILEPGDIDALAAGGTVWVSFYGGQLMPFSIDVMAPREPVANLRMEVRMPPGGGEPDFRAWLGDVPEGMDPADFAEGCAEALREMADRWRAEGG